MLPQLSLLTAILVASTTAQQWGNADTYASAFPGGECSSDADCSDGKQCVYTYCVSVGALSSFVSSLTSANTALIPLIPTSFPASANLPTNIISDIYTALPTGLPTDHIGGGGGGGMPTWGPSHSDWTVSSNFPGYPTSLFPGWGSSAWSTSTSIPTSIPTPKVTAVTHHTTAVPLVTAPSAIPSVGSTTQIHGHNVTSTTGSKTSKSGNTPTGPTATEGGTHTNEAPGMRAAKVGSVLVAVAVVVGIVF